MVIHGITDIREFYNGDARFLEQFPHFGDQGMSAFLEGRLAEKEEKPIKEEAPKKQKNGAELVAGGTPPPHIITLRALHANARFCSLGASRE